MLLHGFGLDHRSLLPLDPTFERAGHWRRIYLDMPGATGTPANEIAGSQEVADAVTDEIRARVGAEPFAVLGNSFGAMIARHIAHELRPHILGLATLAGVFVAPHDNRKVPPRTVLRQDPDIILLLGAALNQYREGAVVESPKDAQTFLQYDLPGLTGADQTALDRIAKNYALDQEPEDKHPDPFLPPTLHLTARQDDVVGYEDAWTRLAHYPRATFATLDAAGHNVLSEQHDLCAALITNWLTRIRQTQSPPSTFMP